MALFLESPSLASLSIHDFSYGYQHSESIRTTNYLLTYSHKCYIINNGSIPLQWVDFVGKSFLFFAVLLSTTKVLVLAGVVQKPVHFTGGCP